MKRNGFTYRKVMVQSIYILNILTGHYVMSCDMIMHTAHACITYINLKPG